jgi:AcrR family transcriptional regulator
MNNSINLVAGGLRARKKQQTKDSISAAAARLFEKRGYENVRMLDIARAADVSEPTIYNYFPTKEHLIFDSDQEFEATLVGLVLNRDRGISLTQSLRTRALEFLNEASRSIGRQTGVPASVAMSPALRRVWVEMNARHADSLANALVLDSDGKMSRLTAKILARSMLAVFAAILEELGMGAMAGNSRQCLPRKLRRPIESIIDQMEGLLEHRIS